MAQKIHHLGDKSLVFVFFHQKFLNFHQILDTGYGSCSKISGPGIRPGYNWVLNFESGRCASLTDSKSRPISDGSKPIMGLEPSTQFFCSPLFSTPNSCP